MFFSGTVLYCMKKGKKNMRLHVSEPEHPKGMAMCMVTN